MSSFCLKNNPFVVVVMRDKNKEGVASRSFHPPPPPHHRCQLDSSSHCPPGGQQGRAKKGKPQWVGGFSQLSSVPVKCKMHHFLFQ